MRVVVTGGSSGIGAALVHQLLEDGHEVVSIDRRPHDSIINEHLHQPEMVLADLSDIDQLSHAAEIVSRGEVDVLINNAGIYNGKPLDEYDMEEFTKLFLTNVMAVGRLSSLLIPRLRESLGRIINITSVVAYVGGLDTPYTASKAAVLNLTQNLARQLGPYGITVNAVAPGIVRGTDVFDKIPDNVRERILAQSVTKRFVQQEEVVKTVMWLAFEAPQSIVGHCLEINGGSHMH